MSTKAKVLLSIGRVMCTNRCHAFAPSTTAASQEASGDLLQACEEDDHIEAEVLPHRHEGDGRHRERRVLKHVAELDPGTTEPVVEQPDLRVEQVRPGERGDRERHDERQEQRRAERAAQRQAGMVQGEREHERGDHRGRREQGGVERRVAEGTEHRRVGEDPRVVLEADPTLTAEPARVGEREAERREHRPGDEGPEQDERRSEEQQGEQAAPGAAGAGAAAAERRGGPVSRRRLGEGDGHGSPFRSGGGRPRARTRGAEQLSRRVRRRSRLVLPTAARRGRRPRAPSASPCPRQTARRRSRSRPEATGDPSRRSR